MPTLKVIRFLTTQTHPSMEALITMCSMHAAQVVLGTHEGAVLSPCTTLFMMRSSTMNTDINSLVEKYRCVGMSVVPYQFYHLAREKKTNRCVQWVIGIQTPIPAAHGKGVILFTHRRVCIRWYGWLYTILYKTIPTCVPEARLMSGCT